MNKKWSLITGLIIVVLVAVGLILWQFSWKAGPPPAATVSSTSTIQTTSTITSSTQPASQDAWGQYDVTAPNTIILVDSQGRRTGEDPLTGTLYHEIPGTAYGQAGNPGHPVNELTFTDLPSGQYTLYVVGGQTGSYGLSIANAQGTQSFQGSIEKGSMVAYVQNYDPTNLASSTFSVSRTASSTAKITTAPPHNLPPPSTP